MAFRTNQPNFSKGEIAPQLHARVDVAYYGAGLKRARNVIGLKYGGVTKRPGTRFVGKVYDATKPARLIPFEFSIEQTYALEMGQAYLRPLALGGFVLNEALTITAITKAAQAQITAQNHGYSIGDQIYFIGISGMVEMNGRIGTVVSVVDANNYRVDIDSTSFSTFTADSGGITRPTPPAPDPAPPTVPPIVTPPAPPATGGGGGAGRNPYEQIP
jgi:hypothetical protein